MKNRAIFSCNVLDLGNAKDKVVFHSYNEKIRLSPGISQFERINGKCEGKYE